MKKVAPSERFRVELDEALAGVRAEQEEFLGTIYAFGAMLSFGTLPGAAAGGG